ncbi:FtsW/RodA/SpoVE family cell cycle protein [bacterium]|nr:FtsW/RodA/SpoVE family cell cycle protein [bacterium]
MSVSGWNSAGAVEQPAAAAPAASLDFPAQTSQSGPDAAASAQIPFWLSRLYLVSALLLAFGVACSFSTTVFLHLAEGKPPYKEFIEHCVFMALGLGAVSGIMLLGRLIRPARRWLSWLVPAVWALSWLAVLAVAVTPLGVVVNGSRRWLDLGVVMFQPSELLKVSVVLYIAQLMCWYRLRRAVPAGSLLQQNAAAGLQDAAAKLRSFRLMPAGRPVFPAMPPQALLIILLSAGLTALQPDLGTTSIILAGGVLTMLLATVRVKDLLVLGAILLLLVGAVFVVKPGKFDYAAERVQTWLNPRAAADAEGYQITQSRGAIAEGATGLGSLTGKGFLKSEQKMNRLPYSELEFVFPVMVEELGFLGGAAIIILFGALAFVALQLSRRCRDPFANVAIAALGYLIVIQAFVNIATTLGSFPLTGITLPFFSGGGTSLLVSMTALGLMAMLAAAETGTAREARSAAPVPVEA